MGAQTIAYGVSARLWANRITRPGYVFIGWAKTRTGPVAYANGQTVKNLSATGGVVPVYARWAKRDYRVVFQPNGGKGKAVAQKMVYGSAARLQANRFSRKGFVFIGWSRTPGGPVSYRNGQAVKNLTANGGNVALYAKWAKRDYRVVFQPNGAKSMAITQKLTYGKAANLRANAFKRPGYAFAGWSRTPGGPVAYRNGQTVSNLTANGGNVTLHAVWRKTAK